ncbi:hypothetical protein QJS04_geneDACA021834 [Acorus gramineus]|uniref:Aminotransferase-like plant mobile domain-containing protein n=1 Tax=Acorus gramineus TaxID=55184 RepID=A0AAV9AD53_ACOGR|nr:hypothetical protein QJS04_geneDACA021834 [Acorus gramineus]
MVKKSGLWPLVEYSFHAPNRHLISSMVERWHPETNTFHLPFGEMTITLDDVTQIIGIPVMGRAVDKTGSSVSVSYLKYLGDMEDIASVGWGAATLAHLYRQLGIASRAKCRQISGFLTLLEVSSFTPPCLVDPFA